MATFFDEQTALLEQGTPFVAVTVVDTLGSTPQDRGAKMLVTGERRVFGTVGGGKVEARAIEEAKRLLIDDAAPKTRFVQWSLEKDIGMTCGGIVRVYFEAFNVTRWKIVVFGAGHVAGALIDMLVRLDCRVTCIDSREEWLSRLPASPKLKTVLSPDMPSEVAKIPEGAFVILMTMGHTTDKPILIEILRTRTFPYLGVIGSNAKAKRLRKDILDAGLGEEMTRAFFCPIGLEIGTNDPHEISISIAAQMLQVRDGADAANELNPRLKEG
jgi:xanthine dehydrogenase accessory factor